VARIRRGLRGLNVLNWVYIFTIVVLPAIFFVISFFQSNAFPSDLLPVYLLETLHPDTTLSLRSAYTHESNVTSRAIDGLIMMFILFNCWWCF
jgi:hypothetical protein